METEKRIIVSLLGGFEIVYDGHPVLLSKFKIDTIKLI